MMFSGLIFGAVLLAQNMFGGLPIDGITCDRSEGAAEHVHAYLQLFERGRPVTVPADIGIPLGNGCLYWLHTHANDGMIHIESPVKRGFTLGQFFDIWGVDLSRSRAASLRASGGHSLRFVVNGRTWPGDPRLIRLRDRESIVIQSGPPFAVPRRPDWSRM